MAKKIVVIGAGFGGMSAAAYLAKAGHEVTIYEKNRTTSAQNRVFKKKGFTFDFNTGWFLTPEVFDDWFRDFDTSAHEQYAVTALNPSFKIFTHETDYEVGKWPDLAELFDALEPGSGEHLNKLLHASEKQYANWRREMQREAGAPHIPKLFKSKLKKSYHATIAKALKNQDLQHLVELPSILTGANPQTLPALYRHLDYASLGMGVSYPDGGWPAVAAAVQKVAKKAGVTFRYGAPVTKIISSGGKVTGVEVKGGVEPCDVVISNVDMQWVETQLLEPDQRSYPETYWKKRDLTPSVLVACIGVKRKLPELAHHSVLLDMDWQSFLDKVFIAKEWSPKPIVFIDNPSKSDTKLAPKGHENIVLQAPIAAGVNPSDEQLERLLLSIVGRIQEQLGYQFMDDIVVADIKAQDYFQETYNNFQGVANGLSPTLAQLTKHRPQPQSHKVRGLYYIGSYTTPASQPNTAIAQGKALAELI